ncbi:MAG TPA: hypothetical protein VM492_17650 [Sumerlaeia bacterium]|nr:hypothetical protein [Sumerlaeia bacterium]
MELRILNSGPAEALVNMAVDRGLIETVSAAARAGAPYAVLRWYAWAPPAFSLGYGQKPEDVFDLEKVRRRPVGWARRPTGGSLVFHGGDLSYSFTIPRGAVDFTNDALYRFVTEAWIEGFAALGVALASPEHVPLAREIPPDMRRLCLASASPGDLLLGGRKVAGSAQRRMQGAWQQQGFFLVEPVDMPDCLKDAEAAALIRAKSAHLRTAGHNVSADRIRAALSKTLAERCEKAL